MPRRSSKKTETVEIRLSPEMKTALAEMSDGRGRSMSAEIRALIDGALRGDTATPEGAPPMTSLFPKLARAALVAVPVLLLAMVYLVSGQSTATASSEVRVFFAELDADGDDRITEPEIIAFLRADGWTPDPSCGTADAEADEPCTLQAMAAEQLQRGDSNRDGAVDYAELEAVLMRDRAEEFLETDLDANGLVSVDELAAMELYWMVEEPELAAEEGIVLNAACLAQLDAEELDGLAATCEVIQEATLYLAEMDSDRDGRVSLIEFLEH